MSHKAAKIGVTTLVLATVFGVLLYTTLGESMQDDKYVDEVVGSQTDWSGKKLQVHGYVVPGSIGKKRDALDTGSTSSETARRCARSTTGSRPTPSRTTPKWCSPAS